MIKNVDVAVLGGGPAGSAAALALLRHGNSVVVFERSMYDNVRVGETLPPTVRLLLQSLGVWDQFVSDAHSPSSGTYCAWGEADLYENDFIFNPYGSGWHVNRGRFDAMLVRSAQKAGADVYQGARVLSCVPGAAGDWEIGIVCGAHELAFRARLLVDATGRASTIVRKCGGKRLSYDRLVGIVGFLSAHSHEEFTHDYTLVEAVEDGWWYSALLPGSFIIVAYMTDADLYHESSKRSVNHWQEQLDKAPHTRARIEPRGLEWGPRIVAANTSRMDRLCGKGWLAIGDAAITFDPLSSQGVYKALESGIYAARAIQRSFAGDVKALQDYASEVRVQFADYLLTRNKYYCRQKRWPYSIFWQRRRLSST